MTLVATLLQLLAAAPVAAGFAWNEAEASAAQRAGPGGAAATQPAGTPFTPTFFTAHEYETVRLLVDLILPRDERSGSATEAGVPEFMDFLMAEEPKLPEASGARPRCAAASPGSTCECQRASTRRSSPAATSSATALLDDISPAPPVARTTTASRAARRAVARPRVLRQLPRSHRDRVLDQPDGHVRSAVPGQSGRDRLDRVSAAALAKLGVRYPEG